MVKFFIVMAMLLGSSVASAENKQITSPDGKLVVTVADMDGRPSYSVSYDNVLFLKPSPLGMIANIGDFSSGMSMKHTSWLLLKRVRYIMWQMKLYFRLHNKGKQFMMLYSA